VPALLPRERALVARLRTPLQVQRWLDSLPYNKGNVGRTLRSFRGVLRHKTAHCMEGALAAAFILAQHGYPPLLLDLSSSDGLDHVCFLYSKETRRSGDEATRNDARPHRLIASSPRRLWGTVSQSRYPGLRGRRPAYRSVRALAQSYLEPFVDATGAVRGFATFDLRDLGPLDWALSERHVWRIERALFENEHAPLRLSPAREEALRARYLAWKRAHPDAGEPPRAYYAKHDAFL
jgi:hypothetical protein